MSNTTQNVSGQKIDKEKTRRLTLAALLTAVVVVLTLLGTAIKFGTFNVNLALVPIVIGAALLGVGYGAWLGFVNAVVILLSGDAAPFFAISVIGTIFTVVAKGTLAGLVSGLVYRFMQRINKYAAVLLAALVCPVVNTGVFLLGCLLFFWKTIGEWAGASSFGGTFAFTILTLIGANFLIEVAINVILAPAIARILGFSEEKNTALIVYGCVLSVVGLGFLIYAMILLHKAWTGGAVEPVAKPGTRYLVMAIFSDVVLVGGAVLSAIGLTRKKEAERLEKKMARKKK